MLRALKRLLRPGGRIALTTIYVTPGLPPAARRRAQRSGPRAVASRADQPKLLASAGFVDIDEVDLTPEFAATGQAWIDQWDEHADELSNSKDGAPSTSASEAGDSNCGRSRTACCAAASSPPLGPSSRCVYWAWNPEQSR